MHKETECSHNPAGPPREIEVLIFPPPEAGGTLTPLVLQEAVVSDWIPALHSARTCCLFHSIELILCSKGLRNRWHLEWEWNPRVCCSRLLMRYDLTRLIPDFRLCLKPPQPTRGLCPAHLPRSAQPTARELHVSSGNPTQAAFHTGYLLAWKVSWATFLPLFSSPPPPQPSPSKGDEMPRRNVTPARKFRFGA